MFSGSWIKNKGSWVQHVLHVFGCNGPTKFLLCILKVVNNFSLLGIWSTCWTSCILLIKIWILEFDQITDADMGMHMGETTSAYRGLVKKPEGRRSLQRPMSRMEDYTATNPTAIECKRIHLAQDTHKWCALVNTGMHIQVPQNAGYFLTSWWVVSL